MASPALAPGKWAAVKCDSRLVRYARQQHGELKRTLGVTASGLSEYDTASPYARFYLEPSSYKESGSEGLVHIRCCYNNKYWVPRQVNGVLYIFCEANEPQEDRSSNDSACNLFKIDRPSHSIRYMDKTTEKYVAKHDTGSLFLASSRPSSEFDTMDLGEALTLPRDNVCFKSEACSMYLASVEDDVKAVYKERSGDKNARHSIHPNEDGTAFRIRCEGNQKFWKLNRFWIDNFSVIGTRESQYHLTDRDAWFEMVKLGGNVVALKNLGCNKFLAPRTLSADFSNSGTFICASEDYITEQAQLLVEECLIERRIKDVEYDLEEARVYDRRALVMAVTHAVNSSSVNNTAKVTLKYSFTTETAWNQSTTNSWGVSVSMQAGFIPKLIPSLDIGIEGHYDRITTDEHGGSTSSTEEQSVDYEITVPPNTRMTLRALATQASCDIPYSYWQEDVLITGDRVRTKLEDGIFRAVKSYDFTYQVTEEKLQLPGGKTKKPKDDQDDQDDGGDDDDQGGEEGRSRGNSKGGAAADGQRSRNMNSNKTNQEEEEDDDDGAEKNKQNKSGTDQGGEEKELRDDADEEKKWNKQRVPRKGTSMEKMKKKKKKSMKLQVPQK